MMTPDEIAAGNALCEKIASGRHYPTIGGGLTQHAVRTLLPKALASLTEAYAEIERLERALLENGDDFRCSKCKRVWGIDEFDSFDEAGGELHVCLECGDVGEPRT